MAYQTSSQNQLPDFIDNIEGNTLSQALKGLLKEKEAGVKCLDEVCIATAFFTSAGFFEIADDLKNISFVRILIGTEVFLNQLFAQKSIEETQEHFHKKQLHESLNILNQGIRKERDNLPFSFESEKKIRFIVNALQSGNIEIRRYEKDFLHAKAYIFLNSKNKKSGGLIVGSSNMTKSGLTTNLELNTGQTNPEIIHKAKVWFDTLWEEATDFEIAKMYQEILTPQTPFDIFIRVLWELYGKEIERDSFQQEGLPLTDFQKHGVIRALRIIDEYGGSIVADEVGLGKSFIAAQIIEYYRQRRQRAILICPASLRDNTWKKFTSEHEFFIECVSYEELAGDQQLNKESDRTLQKLQRHLDEYQLVVVDEAHNYRNPDAPQRAGILRKLLFGRKKHVLFLTATPVNNSLWDFYHLIHFFIKQDALLANKGILSIKNIFQEAMRENPSDLSPDKLFPIIDATTVKRTRQFIQNHYKGDTIKDASGQIQKIIFPSPKAVTVRYQMDEVFSFQQIEDALNPEGENPIKFARYTPKIYLRRPDNEVDQKLLSEGLAGLLRSNLLKRFESSAFAFSKSLKRMVQQHELFLKGLENGQVISTRFLKEFADNEISFEEFLEESDDTETSEKYKVEEIKQDVETDLKILKTLQKQSDQVTQQNDPKLKAVIKELKQILQQSQTEKNSQVQRNKRKVLIFSFFADTVEWVFDFLQEQCQKRPELNIYQGRVAKITGSDYHKSAVNGFAPESMQSSSHKDDYDILITTDVLAEGVNLQQCCHIINYDLPWNPMRLVQRHGRIDRIGSIHREVFLRTIFPTDRLDALLDLKQRILNKITLAARSIGVVSPIEHGEEGKQVFSETRAEIQEILKENPKMFERGGTVSSAQTGEEYRQTLREALKENRDKIVNLPWKAGSGMRKGKEQGFFFCATIGEKRTYLRFVHADSKWNPQTDKPVIKELATCLRLIECEKETNLYLPETVQRSVYDFWHIAKKDILKSWNFETDPANLQPQIRKLNREVAKYIRAFTPFNANQEKIRKALDIVESPWPRRDEVLLREKFSMTDCQGQEKSQKLIDWILQTGLEPATSPSPLPPISKDDIQLICLMAITQES